MLFPRAGSGSPEGQALGGAEEAHCNQGLGLPPLMVRHVSKTEVAWLLTVD